VRTIAVAITVHLDPEGSDLWLAHVAPYDLHSFGQTEADAFRMAVDALASFFDGAEDDELIEVLR
jgi:predicted RNase H-like HicB family nuclease